MNGDTLIWIGGGVCLVCLAIVVVGAMQKAPGNRWARAGCLATVGMFAGLVMVFAGLLGGR